LFKLNTLFYELISAHLSDQEEIKTLGYNSYYNAAPKEYAYEPQARPDKCEKTF